MLYIESIFHYLLFSLQVSFSRYMETGPAVIMKFTIKFISICANQRVQVSFRSIFLSKAYGFFDETSNSDMSLSSPFFQKIPKDLKRVKFQH